MPQEIKGPVQDAIGDGLEVLYRETYRNVARDEGDLADTLKKQQRGDKLGGRIGWWRKGNLRNWKKAGWRSHFVEFGTRERKAQPALGPAYLKWQSWIKRRVNKAVNKGLRKGSSGKFS